MTAILEKLQGGDRRSIGKASEVVQEVTHNPALFESVFNGMTHNDPVIRMRAADVIEKVTQSKPELLSGYTPKVISLLINSKQQELCWHLAQIVPRLRYNDLQEKEIIKCLTSYLLHKSKIVQVSAMEALAIIAQRNTALLNDVIDIIIKQKATGSPAVQSRARKLLHRLVGDNNAATFRDISSRRGCANRKLTTLTTKSFLCYGCK